MNRLHDALQVSLRLLESGENIESVLARYPDLAAELQPLVETARIARGAGPLVVPPAVARRGRARILQRAAELRETQAPRRRAIPAWPRLAVTLGLAGVLVATSTGLVSASSGALPGDQLYGVKRSWEGLQLVLVFQPQDHYQLESQFEQERLDEIDELLGKRRAASIEFSGLVMRQQDGTWLVSGIPVSITPATRLPDGAPPQGVPVVVIGVTRSDGVVEASIVQVLGRGAPLPPLEPSESTELVPKGAPQNAGVSPVPAPTQPSPLVSSAAATHETYDFTGIVESMHDGVWMINGQAVRVDQAQINGGVQIGSVVKLAGYYSADNEWVATNIDVKLSPGQKGVNSTQGSGGDSGTGSGSGSGGSEPSGGSEGGGTGD